MSHYHLLNPGILFPLKDLLLFREEDGWVVLKHPDQDAFLTLQFCHHFFSSPDKAKDYINEEIEIIKSAGNFEQAGQINQPDENTITISYSQLIEGLSHFVFIGIKFSPVRKGFWYMAVTKDDLMKDFCGPIFHESSRREEPPVGEKDKAAEEKLKNKKLNHLESYNSEWAIGGGRSLEKHFILKDNGTFSYNYSSKVNLYEKEGNAIQEEGWGHWEVQKKEELYLILYWHLKGSISFKLEWESYDIITLDRERYFIESLSA